MAESMAESDKQATLVDEIVIETEAVSEGNLIIHFLFYVVNNNFSMSYS